jgi:hypothetical protein
VPTKDFREATTVGTAGKDKGPNIGKRLRSIGYQPLKLVASEPEPMPEALPANANAEGDELEASPENNSRVAPEPKPLPGRWNVDRREPEALPPSVGDVAGEREPLLANDDVNSTHRWALLLNEGTYRYLLRGLLWCGLCDAAFAACLMSTGIRYYGCTSIGCPRPLVNAEEAEQVVWKGFALKHGAEADAAKRNERQAALHEALVRVTVHSGASELDFERRE